MPADFTLELIRREGNALAPVLYEHIDAADALRAQRLEGLSHSKHPLAHAQVRRAVLREGLDEASLPNGWIVSGNTAQSQIILRQPDLNMEMRLLAETRINPGRVPHAGHTSARQALWTPPLFTLESDTRRLLLLMDFHSSLPGLRIVRPVEQGRYGKTVQCDLAIDLLRNVDIVTGTFLGDEVEVDFFASVFQDQEEA